MFTVANLRTLKKGACGVLGASTLLLAATSAQAAPLLSLSEAQKAPVMLAKAESPKATKGKKDTQSMAKSAGESLAAGLEEKKRPKPFLMNSLTRVETHSDRNAPDDFLYGVFVVGRKVQQKSVASFLYIYRYDISDSESDGHFLGLNFTNAPKKRWTLSATLLHTEMPSSTKDARTSSDNTRLTLGSTYTLCSKPKGTLTSGLAFNTETNFEDGQTWDLDLNYDFPLNPKTKGRLGYLYTYNQDLSDSFLHQFSAQVSWELNKDYSLSAEYNLVDPLFDVTAGSPKPDNDNVFRLTLGRKY